MGALVRAACRSALPLGCALLLFAYFSVATPRGRRLVCWQAIMMCQAESECNYAFDHYNRACRPVLNGERKKCPSHCIYSLVQLNLTKNGPALEDCSCDHDTVCLSTKRAIEPCLPRTTSTGCTEARHQCERDPQCSSAMHDYLHHCGKLFSGATCTNACRHVIANLRKIPKGQQLETCACDGTERPICEYVKSSMKALCFDNPDAYEASGTTDDEDEDYYDDTGEFHSTGGFQSTGEFHSTGGFQSTGEFHSKVDLRSTGHKNGAAPLRARRCALALLLASISALLALF